MIIYRVIDSIVNLIFHSLLMIFGYDLTKNVYMWVKHWLVEMFSFWHKTNILETDF